MSQDVTSCKGKRLVRASIFPELWPSKAATFPWELKEEVGLWVRTERVGGIGHSLILMSSLGFSALLCLCHRSSWKLRPKVGVVEASLWVGWVCQVWMDTNITFQHYKETCNYCRTHNLKWTIKMYPFGFVCLKK